jgi:3-oxoadipate CoA-transferase alpha subunit
LIKAAKADRYGNLVFNKTARNFAPVMATACKITSVQVANIVAAGELDPDAIVTPGVFVNRIVKVENPAFESELVAQGVTYP